MQAHDPDDSYVRRAVLIMLSLALLASACATLIHWLSPVHHVMDLVIPPAASVILAALIIALLRKPSWLLGIARMTLLVGALALIAPAWFYTLQASLTPGEQLIAALPPVSSLFVVLIVMVMIFIPGRRAFLLALLGWILIALPVLVYLFAHPHEMLSPRGRELLMTYGPVVMMVVVIMPVQRGLTGTIRRMTDERSQMETMLHRDALTGIHNRRLGQRVLKSHIGSGTPAGVILLDLDRFKTINDTFGHPVGDEVLKTVAQHCISLLREDECFSRWGGEEFLVVLPGVDAQGLMLVANRLLAGIAGTSIGPVESVTASFGVTMVSRTDSLEDVLHRADRALYSAKAQGGNRVVMELAGVAGAA